MIVFFVFNFSVFAVFSAVLEQLELAQLSGNGHMLHSGIQGVKS